MDRHAGHRQIIIADRPHPHDREGAAHHRQFRGGAQPDGAVPLDIEPVEFAARAQFGRQRRAIRQHPPVHVGNDRQQITVQRHLVAIHRRHGVGETGTDRVGTNRDGHAGSSQTD